MAKVDKVRSAKELHDLTGGAVNSVTKVLQMIAWLKDTLRPADHTYITRQMEELNEDGTVKKKQKLSLNRERIRLLSAMLDAKTDRTPGEDKAMRLLDIRQYGGSTTPAKFSRMLDSHVDGS